jgi:periplasmic protein TonB
MGITRKHSNLKLKVIQGNKIFERILLPNESLTIGRSPDNDIVIFNDHYPKKHKLIQCENKECTLLIDEEMDGEIRFKESSIALKDLIAHRLLPKSGKWYKFKFPHDRSGFLNIDDANISFLYDGASPLLKNAPGYSWHKANVKSMTKDLVFKVLLLAFLGIELYWGVFVRGYNLPPVVPPDITKMPERLTRFIVTQPEEPPELEVATTAGDEGEGGPEEEQPEEKPEKPKRAGGSSDQGQAPKPVDSQGLLGLIGGSGQTDHSGSAVDFLIGKGLVKELDELLGNTKLSKRPASGGLGTGTGNGVGAGSGDGIDDLLAFGLSGGVDDLIEDVTGVETVTMQKKGQVNIQQPSQMRGSQAAMGERSGQSVMSIINAQQGRIMYTYNKYLRTDPTLNGKVSFDVTIEANGQISSIRVVEASIINQDFIRDLTTILRRLKFPPIQEGSLTVNLPFVFNKP